MEWNNTKNATAHRKEHSNPRHANNTTERTKFCAKYTMKQQQIKCIDSEESDCNATYRMEEK